MLSLLFFSLLANASTLESIQVTDAASLQKCYAMKPYEAKTKHGDKETVELVESVEILNGCSELAAKLAAAKKTDAALLAALGKEVRRGHRAEASLKVYQHMVAGSLKTCEDMEMYKALKAALTHPVDFPSKSDSDVGNAYKVLDTCIKDKQFLSDIKEEVEGDSGYLKTNLCAYFKSKKIAAKCG